MKKPAKKPSSLFLCFSDRKCDFALEEAPRLLVKAAQAHQVIYMEEPVHELVARPTLKTAALTQHISVVTPVLPKGISAESAIGFQSGLVNMLIAAKSHDKLVFWYLTPMAMAFSSLIPCDACVYDRVGERSDRTNQPPEFWDWDEKLLAKADVVYRDGKKTHGQKSPYSNTDAARLFGAS